MIPPPVATLSIPGDDVVPIVSVTVGGKRLWFGFDSGATGMVLDSGTAAGLGIASIGATDLSGAGTGSVAADYLAPFEVGLGATHFTARQTLSLHLGGRGIPSRIRGILGMPFFMRYVIDVDYAHHRMTLYDPHGYTYHGGGAALPVRIADNQAFTYATIELPGYKPVRHELLIDTGASAIVDDDLVFKAPGPKEETRSAGVGTPRREVRGLLPGVKIGPYEFNNVISIGGGVNKIGSNFWDKFDTVWDFPHGRIYIKPSEGLLNGTE